MCIYVVTILHTQEDILAFVVWTELESVKNGKIFDLKSGKFVRTGKFDPP